MKLHTTIHSWPAMVLGVLFAFFAFYVFNEDVIRYGAPITTEHVFNVAIILGTLGAGHMFIPALKEWRFIRAIGLAGLFAVGTGLCVSGSAGRNAKVLEHKEAEAKVVFDTRKDAEGELKKAREARATLSAQYARECASGSGMRCKGLKDALETADGQVHLYQVRLDGLKPAERANGELVYQAALIGELITVNLAEIERKVGLFAPLVKALFLEFGTIMFFGCALGHAKASKIETPKADGGDQKKVPLLPAPTVANDPVILAVQEHGPLSNQELADKLGITKGAASKLVSARHGVLRRERAGREVRISLATH